MIKRNARNQRGERGQSMIELALSLVFLLVLLSATIDLGWAFYTMVALRDAAEEAAAFGSICPVDEADIRTRLQQSASAPLDMSDIDPANIDVCIFAPGDDIDPANCQTPGVGVAELGGNVWVEVTVHHQILTPLVGMFIGNNWEYPLTVDVTNPIIRTVCIN